MTYARLRDIGYLELCGVELVAGAHARDMAHARRLRGAGDVELGAHGVDGVDHVVVAAEVELVSRLGQVEAGVLGDCAIRVDRLDALFCDVDLALADGVPCGDDLAVEVGERDVVVVDDVDGAYTGARERLHREPPYAAHAKDEDAGVLEALDAVLPQEQGRARELIEHRVYSYLPT